MNTKLTTTTSVIARSPAGRRGNLIFSAIFIAVFAVLAPAPALAANSSIFTIEAWVRPTTSIATKSVVAKAEEMRMVTDASGNPTCQIMSSSSWQTAEVSSLAISIDTWSHIACSYDKVSLKVFVNGVEKGSTALTVAIDDTANALKLGTDDSSDAVYGEFEGKIDDVRFYNYARSAKQITQDLLARRSFSVGGNAGASGSMVGYWKFNEGYGDTANDSSPHDNDGDLAGSGGSCPGAGTCPSWTNSGKFGKALSFDGGDYVDCGSPSSLDITDEITVSAWVKASAQSDTQYILGKYKVQDNNRDWVITTNLAGDTFAFTLSGTGSDINSFTTISTFSVGVWHHFVGVYDNNSPSVNIYIDGVDQSYSTSGSIPSSLAGKNIDLLLGCAINNSGSNYRFFTGTIDEVKIYNYALTEDEVRVEYNQGKAIVLGATGTESDGATPSFSANREYCVPGDTTSCDPPVAEWKMDEKVTGNAQTLYDTSDNANNGTTYYGANTTGMDCSVPGKFGTACEFDGTDDYVSVADHASLNLTDAITVEAWVKPDSVSGDRYIEYKLNGYSIRTLDGGKIRWFLSGIAYDDSVSSLSAGNWYYIVGVYDKDGGTENLKIYINGIVDKQVTKTGLIDSSNYHLTLGAHTDSNNIGDSGFFNGTIDQVKIYDYARTPAQIAWSYNRGKPVAHWPFDECQGTVAHDASGNSNTGTITIGGTVPQTSVGTCTDGLSTSAWYNGVDGKINSAMSFDGVDDYVDCGNITGLTDFSAELWFKTDSLTNNQGILFNDGSGATLRYIQLRSSVDNGEIWFGDNVNNEFTDYNFVTDTWYHVVITKTGTSGKLYVDGNWIQTLTVNDISYNFMYIGARGAAASTYFNGLIDEVKIYNYALTAAQVRMDYNAGAVRFR